MACCKAKEQFEANKYADSVNTALGHGVKNAYVGATVTAFSMYLNLGTAVLILWYGGQLVCDSKGQIMSIGSLITFQLYWKAWICSSNFCFSAFCFRFFSLCVVFFLFGVLYHFPLVLCPPFSSIFGSSLFESNHRNMMNNAFISLGNVFNDLIRSSSAAERVLSLIDARPDVNPDEGEVVKRNECKGHLGYLGLLAASNRHKSTMLIKDDKRH